MLEKKIVVLNLKAAGFRALKKRVLFRDFYRLFIDRNLKC